MKRIGKGNHIVKNSINSAVGRIIFPFPMPFKDQVHKVILRNLSWLIQNI